MSQQQELEAETHHENRPVIAPVASELDAHPCCQLGPTLSLGHELQMHRMSRFGRQTATATVTRSMSCDASAHCYVGMDGAVAATAATTVAGGGDSGGSGRDCGDAAAPARTSLALTCLPEQARAAASGRSTPDAGSLAPPVHTAPTQGTSGGAALDASCLFQQARAAAVALECALARPVVHSSWDEANNSGERSGHGSPRVRGGSNELLPRASSQEHA